MLTDDRHGAQVDVGGNGIGQPLDDDACLLGGDLGDGVPEIVGVVQADGRDDHHRGVDDVGGVPPAAEADLDDGDVDRRVGERRKRHRGDDLELAHARAAGRLGLLVDEFDEGFQFAVRLDVEGRADRLAVDGDALHGRLQMRTGRATGPSVQRRQ